MRADVSALYVRRDGPYPELVADWWDGSPGRDARDYAGPRPVVAHPPCARWGRFWWSDGSEAPGSDDGCFASAIELVRGWGGGVLEHPEASRAWDAHGIRRPIPGCWSSTLLRPDEWVAVVDQVAYGHRARKRTWLVAVGARSLPTPELATEPARVYCASGPGPSRTAALRAAHGIELIGRRERETTPLPFARLLVDIAQSAVGTALAR